MQLFTDARVECSMIDGSMGLGYIIARFCQNPRLSKICHPPRERDRLSDSRQVDTLPTCQHYRLVLLNP